MPCAECGDELKDYEFEFEIETDHQCILGEVKCQLCSHPLSDHSDGGKCGFVKISETKPGVAGMGIGDGGNVPMISACNCPAYAETEETGFELEVGDVETFDDHRPKTQIKKGVEVPVPMRYQKHYFGVTVGGTITCNKCGKSVSFEERQDEQSSSFNELQ